MTGQIELEDIVAELTLKDIRNLHLRVSPPAGKVQISAPRRMTLDQIRMFALTKLIWIRKQQKKMIARRHAILLEYVDNESHFVWGKRYLLRIDETTESTGVSLDPQYLHLWIRPGSGKQNRQQVVEEWFKAQVKNAAPPLVAKWEPLMGVKVNRISVRKMKTRWGSCNIRTHSVRFNAELAKKIPECLEYIVVHELAHLIERRHNNRFKAILDHYLPRWRHYRRELRRQGA